MPRKNVVGSEGSVIITAANMAHMVTVMNELAARGPMQEELMMRVANAGEVAEVIKEIKSRRINRKKFAGKAPAPGAAAAEKAVANRGKGKARKGRKGPQPAPQGEGTADSGHAGDAPHQQSLGV